MIIKAPKSKYAKKVPAKHLKDGKFRTIVGPTGRKTKTDADRRAQVVSQAQNIITKFGGAPELCRVLKAANPEENWNESSVYRWLYPKEQQGTGGLIPTRALRAIVRAARFAGVIITVEDLYPNLADYSDLGPPAD